MNETKENIIDNAYRLFLTNSYEAVSISDISKAIGFTKGALYHHFENKEDLFKAVIDKYLNIIDLGEIKEGITLEQFIEAKTEHAKQIVLNLCIEDQPFIPLNYLSLLIDALRHYPNLFDENDNLFSSEINKITHVLDSAVKSGEIRADIDTSITALNFFSISIGIAANLFRKSSPSTAIETFKLQMKEFYKILKK